MPLIKFYINYITAFKLTQTRHKGRSKRPVSYRTSSFINLNFSALIQHSRNDNEQKNCRQRLKHVRTIKSTHKNEHEKTKTQQTYNHHTCLPIGDSQSSALSLKLVTQSNPPKSFILPHKCYSRSTRLKIGFDKPKTRHALLPLHVIPSLFFTIFVNTW